MEKPILPERTNQIGEFRGWVQKTLPAIYDDSLSYYEMLGKVMHQMNEVGQATNELTDLWNEVNGWVLNDGLIESVNVKLAQMDADGSLSKLINVGVITDLRDSITAVDQSVQTRIGTVEQNLQSTVTSKIAPLQTALDQAKGKIDEVDAKHKFMSDNTYGTFETGAVQSIIANNPEGRTQVLGIPLWDDKALASYDNRDTVASYRSNTSRKATLNVSTATYTRYTAVLPSGTDVSKVKPGMIIDTKHTPNKYSGIITAIDVNTRTLTVNNWYAKGVTSTGQVPPNNIGLFVDMPTKIWTDNVNLYLEKDDTQPENAGAIAELGMLNMQSNGGNRLGVDVVSLGDYKPEASFVSRGSKPENTWNIGYLSVDSDNAFVSNNDSDVNSILLNTASGFAITHSGKIPWHRVGQGHSGQTKTLNSKHYTVFIVTSTDVHYMPEPSTSTGALMYIVQTQATPVTFGGNFVNPTQPGSYEIPQGICIMYCDGTSWYHS